MRATHLELFKITLGERFSYLERYYENISKIDDKDNHPIPESVFDSIFSAEACSKIFGTLNLNRSERNQRKMDLAVIREIYHLWKDHNYFDISPKLCSRLIDTDLKDVDTFFLRAPYRSMYLSLPTGNGLFIPNAETGLHEVESIYITFDEFKDPQNIVIPFQDKVLKNAIKHIHLLICGKANKLIENPVSFFDLIFFEGKVSESISQNQIILNRPNLWNHIVEIFNYATKVLLYINCSNVSIQKIAGLDIEEKYRNLRNPTKKRKLLKKYGRISPESHSLLDLVINRDHNTTNKTNNHPIFSGPKSLEKVRPHFKTQRYGESRAQSKIIWVESYIRGEGSEFYRNKRTYKVT